VFPAVDQFTLKVRIIPEILNTVTDLQLSLRNYSPEFTVNAANV